MKNKTLLLFIPIILLLIGVITSQVLITYNLSNRIDKLSNDLKNSTNEKTNCNSNSTTEEQEEYDISNYIEIKGTDIKTESKDETILVVIGRKTCYYCQLYIPILSEVSEEYDFKPRYIDLEKIENIQTGEILDKKSEEAIINIATTEEYKGFMDEFGATPMTIIVKNNKVIGGIMGYRPKETLIQELQNLKFID